VKIEWTAKKNTESPYFVMVPNTLKSVSFIEKDTKRFPDTSGWAYARFHYDAASDTFTPDGEGRQLRVRVPYDRGGKRLYFHGVPEEVNGDDVRFWYRSKAAGATHQRSAVGRQHRTRRRQC
jgi:Cytochrome P460